MKNKQTQSNRRHFLSQVAMGSIPLSLAWLAQNRVSAEPVKPNLGLQSYDLLPKQTHYEPKAKAMISMFMQGGPSQMDLMDPKPILNKMHLEKFPGKIKYDNAAEASSRIMGSPYKFSKHGECGTEISELMPGLADIVDDVLVIRSMHTGVNNHGQSIHAMNSGRTQKGRPALGSWLTYALGAETDELPAYVSLTNIQCFLSGRLHFVSKFIICNPRGQLQFTFTLLTMLFVQTTNQTEKVLL